MSSRLVLESLNGRFDIVRLKSAWKFPVRFWGQGPRRTRWTRQIGSELTKLKSQELSLLYNKMQFSCDMFPVTNLLYRPSRPAYDFVLNFWKDEINHLVSSWNLWTDYLISSVQKAPQKNSSVRPEILDDRRDGTMPTLISCCTYCSCWRRWWELILIFITPLSNHSSSCRPIPAAKYLHLTFRSSKGYYRQCQQSIS